MGGQQMGGVGITRSGAVCASGPVLFILIGVLSALAPPLAGQETTNISFELKDQFGRFPKEPDQWALMDWDGVFDEAYGFVPGATNVLVFAPGGRLVQHAHGRELDADVLQSIVSPTRVLLAGVGP